MDLLTRNSSLPLSTHRCVQTLLSDVTLMALPIFCSEETVPSGGLEAQMGVK